jgi:hypothetical protein
MLLPDNAITFEVNSAPRSIASPGHERAIESHSLPLMVSILSKNRFISAWGNVNRNCARAEKPKENVRRTPNKV